MTTITGIISSKELKTSSKGKQYATVNIDGNIMNCWDTDLFDAITEGAKVTVEYETNGKFKNITDVIPSGPQTPQTSTANPAPAPAPQPQAGPVSDFAKNKEASMARMSALKNAVEFYEIQAQMGTIKTLERIDIYNLAEQFRLYITTGEMFK